MGEHISEPRDIILYVAVMQHHMRVHVLIVQWCNSIIERINCFKHQWWQVDPYLQKLLDVENPGFNFGGWIRHIVPHATREKSERLVATILFILPLISSMKTWNLWLERWHKFVEIYVNLDISLYMTSWKTLLYSEGGVYATTTGNPIGFVSRWRNCWLMF